MIARKTTEFYFPKAPCLKHTNACTRKLTRSLKCTRKHTHVYICLYIYIIGSMCVYFVCPCSLITTENKKCFLYSTHDSMWNQASDSPPTNSQEKFVFLKTSLVLVLCASRTDEVNIRVWKHHLLFWVMALASETQHAFSTPIPPDRCANLKHQENVLSTDGVWHKEGDLFRAASSNM